MIRGTKTGETFSQFISLSTLFLFLHTVYFTNSDSTFSQLNFVTYDTEFGKLKQLYSHLINALTREFISIYKTKFSSAFDFM